MIEESSVVLFRTREGDQKFKLLHILGFQPKPCETKEEVMPERIYNPIMAMGFFAMFTSYLSAEQH